MLPSHWTCAQATAVFEFLEDLSELIWRTYGGQIQQVLRRRRSVTASPIVANIGVGDLTFWDGERLRAGIGAHLRMFRWNEFSRFLGQGLY